jgi:raffinose/stachyose/melibiose transport system substrate-binding protein
MATATTRRRLLRQAATGSSAAFGAFLLSALGTGPYAAAAVARSTHGGLPKFEGEINFFAQAYTPQTKSKSNPNPPTAFFEVRDAYQKLHPNVKINFLPPTLGGTNYSAWVTTEAAGGTLPDITWNQWAQVNSGYYPAGIYYNLRPYLETPNPYVPGNRRWLDLFNPSIIADITAPNGAIYIIDGDYVATAVYYSHALFAKAGITKLPADWAEFMAIHERLAAKHISPLAVPLDVGTNYGASWWGRKAMTEFFEPEAPLLNVDHSHFSMSTLDLALAVRRGIFTMKNPRYAAVWTLLKQWSKYWAPGYTNAYGATPGQLESGDTELFLSGAVAMLWEGSWEIRTLNTLGMQGKYGVFTLPLITKATTPFSNNIPYQGTVGGPNAAFQYAISTPRANNSMTPAKLAWCVDWLKFITTPHNAGLVINNLGSFVPTIKGAPVVNSTVRSLIPTHKIPWIVTDPFTSAPTPEFEDQGIRLLQEYLQGTVSQATFSQQFDQLTAEAVDQWSVNQHVNLDKYLKH